MTAPNERGNKMPESYTIEWSATPSRRGFYVVTDDEGDRVGMCDAKESIIASTDSHGVVAYVISTLGMDEPEWVEHDGEYIHFGYGKPE